MSAKTERGPLDADAARFLENFGAALALDTSGVQEAGAIAEYLQIERARLTSTPGAGMLDSKASAVATEDHDIGDGVRVRSYLPPGGATGKPITLYIHGGGWVSGSIELHDTTCRILAAHGDMLVVNVGYRLAPESPYPGPLDDCDRALHWVLREATQRYGADSSALVVVGASSGGNLAAALALRARDRGSHDIALQVLLYPALDAAMSGDAYAPEVNGADYFISTEHMRWYWDRYRNEQKNLDDDPYFSPLASRDLAGLPPAIIVSAEFDMLRDDAISYHNRLQASGVRSRRKHYQQIHGFMTLFDVVAVAYPTVVDLAQDIRDQLNAFRPSGRGTGPSNSAVTDPTA